MDHATSLETGSYNFCRVSVLWGAGQSTERSSNLSGEAFQEAWGRSQGQDICEEVEAEVGSGFGNDEDSGGGDVGGEDRIVSPDRRAGKEEKSPRNGTGSLASTRTLIATAGEDPAVVEVRDAIRLRVYAFLGDSLNALSCINRVAH